MAITIKLEDATISLGGRFEDALALVKRLAPRNAFDRNTKVWTLPLTLVEFNRQHAFPMDVLTAASPARSGQHITRYGTRYSGEEWSAKKAIDAIRVPDEIMARCAAKLAAAEQAFLTETGMTQQQAHQVRALWMRFVGDFDEAEAFGKIRFSSPARKAQIIAAMDAWIDAELHADDEAEAYRAREERRILDGTGLY